MKGWLKRLELWLERQPLDNPVSRAVDRVTALSDRATDQRSYLLAGQDNYPRRTDAALPVDERHDPIERPGPSGLLFGSRGGSP